MSRMEELLSSEESGRRSGTTRRKLAIAGSVVLLLALALVLPPLIHLGKYRRSITASMSDALGRPVTVGSMELRLLPMPGIAMTDFTVAEDPAFGYEPALHANSVVASLRLMSLWRGRLEVSRISLDEANLNLVRDSRGQWSIGTVLLRASQIPNAPTGERHAGARPRFPYIEASNARIDFKDGIEKKPFSLTNAEFSMWQASANEWRLRLEAQPVRTDLELRPTDTGTLRVEGSLQRADNLLAMPLDLQAEWSGAQLGQVTRLIAGMDSGWRGDLDVTTTMRGTGGDLQLQSRVQVANLRRQEFQPPSTVNVDATCRSEYRHMERRLNNITCFWPVGGGHLLLTGDLADASAADTHLQLEMNQIPTAFGVRMLGLMRPNAENITVTGTINGTFGWGGPGATDPGATDPGTPSSSANVGDALTGDATATNVALTFPGGELTLPEMHFAAEGPRSEQKSGRKVVAPAVAENAVVLEALDLPMGEPKPLVAEARLTRAGFELHLGGEASLARLMAVGRNFGLLENAVGIAEPRGRAMVNTTTSGNWMPPVAGGVSGIGTGGTIGVENVELRPKFLRSPVEVMSAEIGLTPEEVAWKNVALRYQGITLQGSISFPTLCNPGVACPASFTLVMGSVNAGVLSSAIHGNQSSGFLGQLLSLGEGSPAAWPAMEGTVDCEALELGRLTIDHPVAHVAIDGSKLSLTSLEGKALGGKLDATGAMVVVSGVPQWKLDVHVNDARTDQAAALFHEHWGGGQVSGETSLTLSGFDTAALASSASGDFSFVWQNGGLAANGSTQEPLAHFSRWTAQGTVAKGALTLTGGELTHGSKRTAVQGTIGFDRSVHLTLERQAGPERVNGMLGRPAGAP
ncbi:MAG TPA: AsmA family protein [Acidobacteriaceae bacterium]|jgi:hypothetical protein|nr:AsmA family protein [Acidobacteriaceae bacterium]